MKKSISNGKIVGLCMGDFARGLINGIITTYLLTFFIPTSSQTSLPVFFLHASLVMAIIRGIGTIVDAVTDPLVANWSDRHNGKSGRRIPFMRMSAIPYALFCLLIFFPPISGASYVNAVWVGIMLILYYTFSTLYHIPYTALQAEIVTEPKKRVFLYTIVSLVYVISSAVAFCTSMFIDMLMKAGVSEIWSFRIPFIGFALVGAVCALIPSLIIKEKDYVQPKEYHQSIMQSLKATFSYKSFTRVTVGYLFMWIAFTFFNTAEVYYITRLLDLKNTWVTIVTVISILVGVMTYPLLNILVRKVGKKPLLLGACITYVGLYTAIFFYQTIVALIGAKIFAIIIGLVIAFPIAITNIVPSALFADFAQYDTIMTGENRAGMFLAARNFVNKLCQSIVVIACSLLLGMGADGTGSATLVGIRYTALVAMIFIAVALIIYWTYNDKTITEAIKKSTQQEN